MSKKWAVAFEYELEKGICHLARKDAGTGEVALFESKEEAEEWVMHGEDLQEDMWDINYISFNNE